MRKLLALALSALLVLSGCGSSNDNQNETNTLRVGMECNYAPFNWTDASSNSYNIKEATGGYCDGYDVQIAKRIAEQLNMELEIVKLDWDALQPALSTNTIDAIIAGMTATPERDANGDFTTPYYQSEMVMIVLADSDLASATTLDDFSGRKVLGQLNTMYDDVIDQIENVIHLVPLESYPYMIASLLNGEAEALTAETPVGVGAVAAHPELALVEFEDGQGFDIDLSETSVSICVREGNTELLNSIQNALDSISEEERNTLMNEATLRQPANN